MKTRRVPRESRGDSLPGDATRRRILETAERLFADHGLEGVSLRTIVTEARVNLAAVHYHFGSKAELFEEVFARRARVITEKRLRMLDACCEGPGRPPMLEQILEAFLRPALEDDPEGGGAAYARMRARLAAESSERSRELPSKYFDESSRKFLAALRRELPDLPAAELYWRFHILLGAMFFTMANPARIERLSDGAVDTADTEMAIHYLVGFFSEGLCAGPLMSQGGVRDAAKT